VVPNIDRDNLEQLIHLRVNGARMAHGLDKLSHDEELVAIARSHSKDMANRGFFAHENPDGETFDDRYTAAGYDCRVPAGEKQYLGGAENIAKTHAGAPLETGECHESAADVSMGVVSGWLDSPRHRQNILNNHWRRQGIGIVLREERDAIAVYVTQNFC